MNDFSLFSIIKHYFIIKDKIKLLLRFNVFNWVDFLKSFRSLLTFRPITKILARHVDSISFIDIFQIHMMIELRLLENRSMIWRFKWRKVPSFVFQFNKLIKYRVFIKILTFNETVTIVNNILKHYFYFIIQEITLYKN